VPLIPDHGVRLITIGAEVRRTMREERDDEETPEEDRED